MQILRVWDGAPFCRVVNVGWGPPDARSQRQTGLPEGLDPSGVIGNPAKTGEQCAVQACRAYPWPEVGQMEYLRGESQPSLIKRQANQTRGRAATT